MFSQIGSVEPHTFFHTFNWQLNVFILQERLKTGIYVLWPSIVVNGGHWLIWVLNSDVPYSWLDDRFAAVDILLQTYRY